MAKGNAKGKGAASTKKPTVTKKGGPKVSRGQPTPDARENQIKHTCHTQQHNATQRHAGDVIKGSEDRAR